MNEKLIGIWWPLNEVDKMSIPGKQLFFMDGRVRCVDIDKCHICYLMEYSDNITDGSDLDFGTFCAECGDHLCTRIQNSDEYGPDLPCLCSRHLIGRRLYGRWFEIADSNIGDLSFQIEGWYEKTASGWIQQPTY